MSRKLIALIALAALVSLQWARARADDKAADKPAEPAKVQPVDFHKLQELMPDAAAGVARSALEGENMTLGEWVTSRAKANYTKPDDDGSNPSANIEITDYIAAPQMVAGMTAWKSVPINIENDQGYQRTVKIKDSPAMEIYTKEGDSRQMMILVADRFLLNIEAAHVPEAGFKKLIEDLPLEKLAKLK